MTKRNGFRKWATILLALGTGVCSGTANGQTVEEGKFRLHKFEQAIGWESYQITKDGNGFAVKADFKFNDRGTDVPLAASLKAKNDWTPISFAIKGKNSRMSDLERAVEVNGEQIRVRDREEWKEGETPQQFFTIAGYAPVTMQMLLVRYWSAHGFAKELAVFPEGRNLWIEPRGQDKISFGGKTETLQRFLVEGLIWGREWLWFNMKQELIAAVTTDAEFDHFEAIRDGYEDGLKTFVALAGKDGMGALAQISATIPGSRATNIALVGGTLVDGTGKAAVPDSVVLVKDGRIVKAGTRNDVEIPKNFQLIDARGKTILPGLWDMHAHFEQVEWGPIYLAAGVTTVRDCGNELEFITTVRDSIAEGHGLGPRILAAGFIDGTGPTAIGVIRADTPEQAREWVDKYHQMGFQQVKIYSSVKLPQIAAAATEAHKLGMTATGHIPEGVTTREAIEAGQDQISHIPYILQMMAPPFPPGTKRAARLKTLSEIDLDSDAAKKEIAFLKEHHTVVDPTLVIYEMGTASTEKPFSTFEPGVAKVAPELAQALFDVGPPNENSEMVQKMFDKYVALVGKLHVAGVPVVVGTDQTVPGHSVHREIELYTMAGFTPLEAIQAATIVPARAMGMEKELGTIEAGKRADLILVKGNPLENIHDIRNVEFVMSSGKMFKTAELWQSVGFLP
ncbi:MAG TPA: amidohydrolase family protein [Candidatus Acidoferrum sp.]|nr:amidohydrolase family protein [Candidatus Acidoferrum sp.]